MLVWTQTECDYQNYSKTASVRSILKPEPEDLKEEWIRYAARQFYMTQSINTLIKNLTLLFLFASASQDFRSDADGIRLIESFVLDVKNPGKG